MLRSDLEVAVTCGYLLCRIADTVEDEAELESDARDTLYRALLATLEKDASPEAFTEVFKRRFTSSSTSEAEYSLASNLDVVIRVLKGLRPELSVIVLRWVAEMARGMNIYSRRAPGSDGWWALKTLTDLERYCYFVAGTVGHMLTELFTEELSGLTPDALRTLELHAEEFGLGLQLTNILKDITDDRDRCVSFIPRTVVAAEALTLGDLIEPTQRSAAHRALTPIFQRAERALHAAFQYCLAIPGTHRDVRLFCLLPLFMAVATLRHARNNDAQFDSGQPVKISRQQVSSIISQCVRLCEDDAGLARLFGELSPTPHVATAPSSALTDRAL